MINIPAKFTKGKKARRTLVSLEAKPYLMKRLNEIEENDIVFGTGSTSVVTEAKLLNYVTKKVFPKMGMKFLTQATHSHISVRHHGKKR